MDYFIAHTRNIYVPGNTSKENNSRGERRKAVASHSLCVLPGLSHWCPQMVSCHFQLRMLPVLVQGVPTHHLFKHCVFIVLDAYKWGFISYFWFLGLGFLVTDLVSANFFPEITRFCFDSGQRRIQNCFLKKLEWWPLVRSLSTVALGSHM